jgi:hypothetical protein
MQMQVDVAAPAQVTAGKTIGPKDFIDEATLPHIVALLEQNSRLAAQKTAEWQKEAELHEALNVMDYDDDFDF